MRSCPWILATLLVALGAASAGDEEAPPPTVAQAADEVLAAYGREDAAALAALAKRYKPDPWLVAEELLAREKPRAAAALAGAGKGKDLAALPAYLASRQGARVDPATHARIAEAAATEDPARSLGLLEGLEAEGGTIAAVSLAYVRARSLARLGRMDANAGAYVDLAAAAGKVGWIRRANEALFLGGLHAAQRGNMRRALEIWKRDLEMSRQREIPAAVIASIVNLGNVYMAMGDVASAKSHFEQGVREAREIGHWEWEMNACGSLATLYHGTGDYAASLAWNEKALAIAREHDNDEAIRNALNDRASVRMSTGRLAQALEDYEEAYARMKAAGDVRNAAGVLSNVAYVQKQLGQYARALATYDEVEELARQVRDPLIRARSLAGIGMLHLTLGNPPKALAFLERALSLVQQADVPQELASTLDSLAGAQVRLGRYEEAIANYRKSLEIRRRIGDRAGAAGLLLNLGVAQQYGDQEAALQTYGRALPELRALGQLHSVAHCLGLMAIIHENARRHARARELYAEGLVLATEAEERDSQLTCLEGIARCDLKTGEPAKAIESARKAVALRATVVSGLGDEQGARAGEEYAEAFDVGLSAAARLGDVEAIAFFLESGKAGGLRESLAVADADQLRGALLPEPLARAEAEATERVRDAMAEFRRASLAGGLEATREARQKVNAARAHLQDVVTRIQRTEKAAAAVRYPEADDLATMRGTLAAGEALVLYGSSYGRYRALVVERGGARFTDLDTVAALDAAAAALPLADESQPAAEAVSALAELLIAPLRLSAGTRRVLVSPAGALAYVPFALLMPGRDVAYVPSGTTYGVLRRVPANQGTKVLALGDPDYGASGPGGIASHRGGIATRLTPLPATRKEVEAVGDVRLLGGEATETRLREALAKERGWRAVHFACHGLVDTEQPLLSSLALTPDEASDGFLSCLELYRLRIPADLVVLSACETSRGKVYETEGILGLLRPFLFAGAPRVLCSLWPVDDEAAGALMTKFYALWNPKDGSKRLGAAEALRRAQEHVRGQPKWSHPHYWAAWVLWGLPD